MNASTAGNISGQQATNSGDTTTVFTSAKSPFPPIHEVVRKERMPGSIAMAEWRTNQIQEWRSDSNSADRRPGLVGVVWLRRSDWTTDDLQQWICEERITDLALMAAAHPEKTPSDIQLVRMSTGLIIGVDTKAFSTPKWLIQEMWTRQQWSRELCSDDVNTAECHIEVGAEYVNHTLGWKLEEDPTGTFANFYCNGEYGWHTDVNNPSSSNYILTVVLRYLRAARKAKTKIFGWVVLPGKTSINDYTKPPTAVLTSGQWALKNLSAFVCDVLVAECVNFDHAKIESVVHSSVKETQNVVFQEGPYPYRSHIWCVKLCSLPQPGDVNEKCTWVWNPEEAVCIKEADVADMGAGEVTTLILNTDKDQCSSGVQMKKMILGAAPDDQTTDVWKQCPNYDDVKVGSTARLSDGEVIAVHRVAISTHLWEEFQDNVVGHIPYVNLNEADTLLHVEHLPLRSKDVTVKRTKQTAESLLVDITNEIGGLCNAVVKTDKWAVAILPKVDPNIVSRNLWEKLRCTTVRYSTGQPIYTTARKNGADDEVVEPPTVIAKVPLGTSNEVMKIVAGQFGDVEDMASVKVDRVNETYLVVYKSEEAARYATGINITLNGKNVRFTTGDLSKDKEVRLSVNAKLDCVHSSTKEAVAARKKAAITCSSPDTVPTANRIAVMEALWKSKKARKILVPNIGELENDTMVPKTTRDKDGEIYNANNILMWRLEQATNNLTFDEPSEQHQAAMLLDTLNTIQSAKCDVNQNVEQTSDTHHHGNNDDLSQDGASSEVVETSESDENQRAHSPKRSKTNEKQSKPVGACATPTIGHSKKRKVVIRHRPKTTIKQPWKTKAQPGALNKVNKRK